MVFWGGKFYTHIYPFFIKLQWHQIIIHNKNNSNLKSWKSYFYVYTNLVCIHVFLILCNPINQQILPVIFIKKCFAWFLNYLWLEFLEALRHSIIDTHHHLFSHFRLLSNQALSFWVFAVLRLPQSINM